MFGKNSTKVIFSSTGCSFLLKPILHIKSNLVRELLFQKVGLETDISSSTQTDSVYSGDLNESQKNAEIKNEVSKLLNLLPRNQNTVAQFLQTTFEKISTLLLQSGNQYLSFQFYIMSGRFSIQYILDTYFEHFMQLKETDLRGVSAILTASMHKIIEEGTFKADVTFLFCVYTFMRSIALVDADSMSFTSFVDLMHGKKFKYVRAGTGVTNQSTSITPEVFILQIDLLTSYFKNDEDLNGKEDSSTDKIGGVASGTKNHFCPLYQVIFNVCRFVNSKRWHKNSSPSSTAASSDSNQG